MNLTAKEAQTLIKQLRAEGRTWLETETAVKKAGFLSQRGKPYSLGSITALARYGMTYRPSTVAARNGHAAVSTAPQRRRRRKSTVRGAAAERSINHLIQSVIGLAGVDRDTKLALIELVSKL